MGRIIFQVLEVFARLTHKNYADDSQAAHHNDSHNGQVPELLDAVMISLKPTKELVGANTRKKKTHRLDSFNKLHARVSDRYQSNQQQEANHKTDSV